MEKHSPVSGFSLSLSLSPAFYLSFSLSVPFSFGLFCHFGSHSLGISKIPLSLSQLLVYLSSLFCLFLLFSVCLSVSFFLSLLCLSSTCVCLSLSVCLSIRPTCLSRSLSLSLFLFLPLLPSFRLPFTFFLSVSFSSVFPRLPYPRPMLHSGSSKEALLSGSRLTCAPCWVTWVRQVSS